MVEIITSTDPTLKTSIKKEQIKAAGLKTFADTTQIVSSFPDYVQIITAAYILGMNAGLKARTSEIDKDK